MDIKGHVVIKVTSDDEFVVEKHESYEMQSRRTACSLSALITQLIGILRPGRDVTLQMIEALEEHVYNRRAVERARGSEDVMGDGDA